MWSLTSRSSIETDLSATCASRENLIETKELRRRKKRSVQEKIQWEKKRVKTKTEKETENQSRKYVNEEEREEEEKEGVEMAVRRKKKKNKKVNNTNHNNESSEEEEVKGDNQMMVGMRLSARPKHGLHKNINKTPNRKDTQVQEEKVDVAVAKATRARASSVGANELEVELSWPSRSEGDVTPQAQVEPCRRARERFLWNACQSAIVLCCIAIVFFIVISIWIANVSCMRSKKAPGCAKGNKTQIKYVPKCKDFTRRSQFLQLYIGGETQQEWRLRCQESEGTVMLELYDIKSNKPLGKKYVVVKCGPKTAYKWESDSDPNFSHENVACSCSAPPAKYLNPSAVSWEGLRANRLKVKCKDSSLKPKMESSGVISEDYVISECRRQYGYNWKWQLVVCEAAKQRSSEAYYLSTKNESW